MDLYVILALLAMLMWGFGDFTIEHATRKAGELVTLFFIGLFGAIVFAPSAIPALYYASKMDFVFLVLLSITNFSFSFLLFEAFRRGKLTVVETLYQLELPFTILFAVTLLGEAISPSSVFLITFIFGGTLLLSKAYDLRKTHFEKGWWLAIVAAFVSAINNMLLAHLSKEVSPTLAIWFPWTFIVIFSLIFLWREANHVIATCLKSKRLLIIAAVLDTGGWLAYSKALSGSNLSLIAGIVAGYAIISAALGFWINNEKLNKVQLFGGVLTLVGCIVLAVFLS